MTKTIKEISALLEAISDLSDPYFIELKSDSRSGVKKAVNKRKKAIQAMVDEDLRLDKMLSYEKILYQEGYSNIAGIDEVGRGPLAGPVVAACVILPKNCKIRGLNDSKKIPKSQHLAIYKSIQEKALGIGVGIIDNHVIDEINIYQATKIAMITALKEIKGSITQPDYLLIDAMTLETNLPQQSIIKGDANSLSIAAASIVAKVTRDQLMIDYEKAFPGYDFAKNAGYGTRSHLEGLKKFGVTPIHRRSFEPIKSMR